MAEYLVTITVRTNVPTDRPDFTGWDAVSSALGYGLEDLLAAGEYQFVGATVDTLVRQEQDTQGQEDEDEDEDEDEEV